MTTSGLLNLKSGDALLADISDVTATAAELNILDGVTATAAELNILDGVTSTTAELNILDGVTSTAAELNILDGVTSTAAELNILDGVTATAAELNTLAGGTGVTKDSQTVGYAEFTDGGAAVGTFDLTATVPVGATFLYAAVTAVTGFAGDTSAALTIGDGTDVDRYNTSTIDVFSTAANGVAAGDPSGTRYHDTAATVKLTITTASDWGLVSAGSVTVEMYYLT